MHRNPTNKTTLYLYMASEKKTKYVKFSAMKHFLIQWSKFLKFLTDTCIEPHLDGRVIQTLYYDNPVCQKQFYTRFIQRRQLKILVSVI